jgi:hypothetical protein
MIAAFNRAKHGETLWGSDSEIAEAISENVLMCRRFEALFKRLKPAPEEWFRGINQVSEVSGLGPDSWGEPVLIDPAGSLPTFPVACLPPELGQWAAAVAESSQTPVDLAAMLSLSAVAVAVQKKVVIQPYPDNPGYHEPANIWGCIPLPSGSRKTHVVGAVRAPFEKYCRDFLSENKVELELNREEKSALTSQKESHVAALAVIKDDAKEYSAEREKLKACLQRISEVGDSEPPRFFADDVTPERLTVLMARYDGRIAILSDEGGCFDHFAGMYSKLPNIDVYLHGHSGGTIHRDRQVSKDEIKVEQAALTIGVSPQPQVLGGMRTKDRLLGRGLLARFLYALPKSTLGNRDWTPPPVPPAVASRYMQAIIRLLKWNPKEPITIKLSDEAFKLWLGAARDYEVQLKEGGPLSSPGIQEWTSKLPGAIARISLLLHCVRSGGNPPARIDAATMKAAIEIGAYLVPHALAAFKLLRTDPDSESARVLQGWIASLAVKGKRRFSKSEAQQSHKSRFPNVADIEPALRILSDRQICRPVIVETKGRGRPPAFYEINPALLDPDSVSKPETSET